jgi:RNA polymerase sigma factor (sigma-70 family)
MATSTPFPLSAPTALADALEERLRQARPRLLRIAQAFGVSPDGAEDIAQETSLRAWRNLAEIRERDHFDAWLNAICRNQCRMYLRTLRRAPEAQRLTLSAADDAADDGAWAADDLADPQAVDPLDAVCADDAALLLERAFAHLSPPDRVLLEMRYLRNLPVAEAALTLGVAPHALEARLHRARVHLRETLAGPLRHDAEVFGLHTPGDDSWRATRIGCYLCGRRKLLGRFEAAVNGRLELRLRCPACSLHSAADVFRSKGIASLDGLRAFRPALTRSLRAMAEQTEQALASGSDVCLHCGSSAPRRIASADEFPANLSQTRQRHWVVAPCPQPGCPGLGAWTALDAVIGANPQAQRFTADHPRWVAASDESVEWQGRSAIRFHLSDMASAAQLMLLADRDSLLTLAAY